MIEIVIGDLIESKEKYLVHQTNCLSHYAAGIAAVIFDKYPYSNIYVSRMKPDVPGEIIVCGNGQDQRYIVNLMGQYNPGGPSDLEYPDKNGTDTAVIRQQYFYQALQKLAKISDLESVAFPVGIGCGIAAGNWEWYYQQIKIFSDFIEKKQGALTKIYCLPEMISKYD